MNLNKENLLICAIFGIILGALALIPYTIFYVLLVLFFLSAPLCALYIDKKLSYVNFEDYKITAYLGSIMGFVSFISFIAVFIPCTLVISFLFKSYYNYGIPYFLSFDAIWILFIIIITVALICASTNAVSLMGYKFTKDFLKGIQNGKNN